MEHQEHDYEPGEHGDHGEQEGRRGVIKAQHDVMHHDHDHDHDHDHAGNSNQYDQFALSSPHSVPLREDYLKVFDFTNAR